jgi:hypothetical protein
LGQPGKTIWPCNRMGQVARSHGYDVNVVLVDVSLETSVARAVRRWRSGSQGFIDPDFIISLVKNTPEETYNILKQHPEVFNHYGPWSTEAGGKPRRIETIQ